MHASRRRLLQSLLAAPLAALAKPPELPRQPSGSLTDVPGIRVGHWTSDKRPTGCTAILFPEGAIAGVDVRGGGPGTRETDLLRPEATIESIHGISLSGGSAYGLASADGVMAYLEEQGIGFPIGGGVVPIVPAAILFDLGMGDDPSIRPDKAAGYAAAVAASTAAVAQGNIGAGTGATVGKLLGGRRSMKGGLGSASIRLPNGIVIGALAAVNAVGDIVHPDNGVILAGARTTDGAAFADAAAQLRNGLGFEESRYGQNTTICVVAASVNWTQAQAAKVAQMAHDGLARSIRPVHMPFDGDTIFAAATGGPQMDAASLGRVGALAADVLSMAVVSAIIHAESLEGRLAYRDLP